MDVEPLEDPASEPSALGLADTELVLPPLTATHRRILELLADHLGEKVEGRDIARVAGISEWARRIRELRVEQGYEITTVRTGPNSLYRLERTDPDRDAAERWFLMKQIRNDPQHGAQSRILAYLQARVGEKVDKGELQYVAKISEWARRVRELRVEQGWILTTSADRTDLRPGEYVLESLQPLPPSERLTAEERTRILERDGYRCRRCGWGVGDRPTALKRFVEVHHKVPVSERGGSDESNLETLCNACHDAIPAG